VLAVRVHAANVFDGKAARQVITNLSSIIHTVKKIWGDRAYSGANLSKRTARFPYFTSPLGGQENIRLAESMASIE